jgi:hypothetical protein
MKLDCCSEYGKRYCYDALYYSVLSAAEYNDPSLPKTSAEGIEFYPYNDSRI